MSISLSAAKTANSASTSTHNSTSGAARAASSTSHPAALPPAVTPPAPHAQVPPATTVKTTKPVFSSYRLPIEPLADVVERRGGWSSLGIHHGVEQTGDALRYSERVLRSWRRARNQGWVSVWTADDICIHVLGVHPSFVFGDAWWQAMTDIDRDNGVNDFAAPPSSAGHPPPSVSDASNALAPLTA